MLIIQLFKEIIVLIKERFRQCKDQLNQPGMTWEEAKMQCPDGIVPACHNAAQSVTISGAADMMSSFVEKVKVTGGFVREVDSNGIPFHSPHLKKAGKAYLAALQKVDYFAYN